MVTLIWYILLRYSRWWDPIPASDMMKIGVPITLSSWDCDYPQVIGSLGIYYKYNIHK